VQNISMFYPGSGTSARHFQHLKIQNPAGVAFLTNATVNGLVTFLAGAGPATGATVVQVAEGISDAVGTRWQTDTDVIGDASIMPPSLGGDVLVHATWTIPHDLSVDGNFSLLSGAVTLGGDVEIEGALSVSGSTNFILGGHSALVGTDFTTSGGAVFTMTNPADVLDIAGNVSIDNGDSRSRLTAGTMYVAGNFSVGSNSFEAFSPSGSHTVVFNGAAHQSISMFYPGAGTSQRHFHHAIFDNPLGVGFTSNATINGLATVVTGGGAVTSTGSTVTVTEGIVDVTGGRWQTTFTVVAGNATAMPPSMTTNLMSSATWTLPGALAVTGTFGVSAGTLTLGGDIDASGSISISGGNLVLNGHHVHTASAFNTSGGGVFTMTNSADILDIDGDATIDNGDSRGRLTAGLMHVRGNFVAAANSFEAFSPGGDHTVVFDGVALQTVSMFYPGAGTSNRHFQNIIVDNPTELKFLSDPYILGTISSTSPSLIVTGPSRTAHIYGGMSGLNGGGGRWQIATTIPETGTTTLADHLATALVINRSYALAGNLIVTGSLRVTSGGNLSLSGRELTVNGNAQTDGGGIFHMTSAADRLFVNGNISIDNGDSRGHLTAGEMWLTGDFTVGSNSFEAFAPEGTHKVIFNGTTLQTTSMFYPGAGTSARHFQNVAFSNSAGVSFSSDHYINGTATILSGTGAITGAGRTVRVAGGISDLAGGSQWDVATTAINGAATVMPAEITNLQVEATWTTPSALDVTGTLFVTAPLTLGAPLDVTGSATIGSAGNLILNGRVMTVGDDFATTSGGVFTMTNAADVLDVADDVNLDNGNSVGRLTNGNMYVGGDFSVGANSFEAFSPSGLHTVIFNGGPLQTVNMFYPGETTSTRHFQNVDIATATELRFLSDTYVLGTIDLSSTGTVTAPGRVAHVYTGIIGADGGRWQAATTIPHSSTTALPNALTTTLIINRTFNLARDIVLTGPLQIVSSGDFVMNGFDITVTGDFSVSGGGLFTMTNAGDRLIVAGNTTIDNGNSNGHLTAGEMRLSGNFSVGSNSFEAFAPSGSHTLVFEGTGLQTVSMFYPGFGGSLRHFQNVTILNASASGVQMDSNISIAGNMDIYGRLVVSSGKIVDVFGNLDLENGSYLVNNGTLKYGTWGQHEGSISGPAPVAR
jgi:hypothetical protein